MDTGEKVCLLFESMKHIYREDEKKFGIKASECAKEVMNIQQKITDVDFHPGSSSSEDTDISDLFDDIQHQFKEVGEECNTIIADKPISSIDIQWTAYFIVILTSILDDVFISTNNFISKLSVYEHINEVFRPTSDIPTAFIPIDTSIRSMFEDIRQLKEMIFIHMKLKHTVLLHDMFSFREKNKQWLLYLNKWKDVKTIKSMCTAIENAKAVEHEEPFMPQLH